MFTDTDRFQSVALLGRGSMGVVYRARDAEMGADVALKTLDTQDPDRLYRLKQEFRVLAGIAHPNLVDLYELVVVERECFFTMEFVDGVSFTVYLRDGLAAPAAETVAPVWQEPALRRFSAVVRQLVDGLAALHDAGKLHRDVKPSNVLVTGAGRVVLLDFGLATALRPDVGGEVDTDMAGTVAYMAPELAWGQASAPAADWYSVGVVLYEALTGRLPFEGPAARVLLHKMQSRPPSPRAVVPSVPEYLDALVTALLDPQPECRPGPEGIRDRLAQESGATAIRVPASTLPSGETSFVGRRDELAMLSGAAARAGHGRPCVVRVVGPSGIGKSELIRRFLATLPDSPPSLVLHGRCHPQETVPYKALDAAVDSLSRFLLGLPEADVAELVPAHATALTRVFPVLARVPALAADHGVPAAIGPLVLRRQAFDAFRELMVRVARIRRLVLWIDDLQWTDADSGALLRDLLRSRDPPALLLLFSYRREDQAEAGLLDFPQRRPGEQVAVETETIELGPLADEEAQELARRLCAADLDKAVAAVARESGGSPFFIGQLARYLAGTSEPASAKKAVPSLSMAALLRDRFRRLAPNARDLLETVSVAGRPLERGVALTAAGLERCDLPFLLHLEQDNLLRAVISGEQTAVDVYHDRIRDSVLEQLSRDGLRMRHGLIAEVLEDRPGTDPEELFMHFLQAGQMDRARPHGMAAADRAASALAFDRAARIYRQVLDLGVAAGERVSVLAKFADALANCGRGREAAENFEAAAREAGGAGEGEVLQLRRRAAEQYLRAGALAEGVAAVRTVLSPIGIALPDSRRRLLRTALGQRIRLEWRGTHLRAKPARAVPPSQRLRLDACWGAAITVSVMDQVMGDVLSVRHLIEALAFGERAHGARALAFEAIKCAQIGGRFLKRRSARLLRAAAELAGEVKTPYERAFLQACLGATAYEDARWRETSEQCGAATKVFREQCRGAVWETVNTEAFALSALAHMGELAELSRRLPAAIADADERGDLYGGVGFRSGHLNLFWLAAGRPEEARRQAEEAIARWPATRAFHLQHYLHLIAAAQADLYLGDVWSAWRRIEMLWPRARRAFFLMLEGPEVELRNLRARAALAAAVSWGRELPAGAAAPDPRWTRRRLLRVAAADARRLARRDLPTGRPFATLLRAGIAEAWGRTEEALPALAEAADDFRTLEMSLYETAARHRHGALLGGDAGKALCDKCDDWARGRQIADPAALRQVSYPASRSS